MGLFGRGIVGSVVNELLATIIMVSAMRGLVALPARERGPWAWLVGGSALWVMGDIGWDITALVSGESPTISLADIPYLVGYPVTAIGAVKLLRLRSPRSDREGLLDGLVVSVSATMTAWQFFIAPEDDTKASFAAQVVAAAYPIGDVILLSGLAWLAFSPGRPSGALRLLMAFAGITLVLDMGYAYATNAGTEVLMRVVNTMYPVAYLFLSRAIRHREVLDVTEPVHQLVRRTNPVRLVLLGVTMYTAPMLAFVSVGHRTKDLVIGLGGTTVLAVIVITRFVLLVREREAMETSAAYKALHDELTGLANRKLLLDRIDFAQQRHTRTGKPYAVLFIDLDRFKSVNDTWGHAVGNEVLVAVGKSLRSCVRAEDLVARIGGDEFALVCENITDTSMVHTMATRIVSRLGRDLPMQAKLVSASVGMVLIEPGSTDATDAESVLHRADLAMYRVKNEGGRAWREFDDELRTWSAQRRSIEAELSDAIEQSELRLVYQPIVALDRSRSVGLEALLRWDRPGRTSISPADFIPVAEATGLIIPIGEWVLNEAAQFAARNNIGYVTVNVSAVQIRRSDVADAFGKALLASGADPLRIVVELTESALLTDVEKVDATLASLVDLGARIAVDDFGTGYSSLGYIDRFPVSIVKVDKSLVDRVDEDEAQRAVVRAITGLAASLGFTVVAEGIERESQRQALIDLDVQYGQGWLFCRALEPDAALEFQRTFGRQAAEVLPSST